MLGRIDDEQRSGLQRLDPALAKSDLATRISKESDRPLGDSACGDGGRITHRDIDSKISEGRAELSRMQTTRWKLHQWRTTHDDAASVGPRVPHGWRLAVLQGPLEWPRWPESQFIRS